MNAVASVVVAIPVGDREEALFDLDVELCIGCLRCVRVCRELRDVGALSFVIKDGRPVVGRTAGPTRAESGCRFCGACVEVCPAGALQDKTRAEGSRREEILVPCRSGCPAGIDIPRLARHIAAGERDEAAAVIREKVPLIMKYPDHQFRLGKKRVLVTHGHYLDRKQTKFADIMDALEDTRWNRKRARRLFFQRTAQYQALASAVSYVSKTRVKVDWWHKKLSDVWDAAFGGLRDEPMSGKQLTEVEKYLLHYRDLMTDVFIFGHTHEACHTNTFHRRSRSTRLIKDTRIDGWNTGSFLEHGNRDYSGSFVVVDDRPADGLKIKLVYVGKLGKPTVQG